MRPLPLPHQEWDFSSTEAKSHFRFYFSLFFTKVGQKKLQTAAKCKHRYIKDQHPAQTQMISSDR